MDFNTVRRAFFARGKESFGGFARGYFIWDLFGNFMPEAKEKRVVRE